MTWNLVTTAFGDSKFKDGQKFLDKQAKKYNINHIQYTEKDILESSLYADNKDNEWMSLKDKYGWCSYKPYFLLRLMDELPEGDKIAFFDTLDIFHPELFNYIDGVMGDEAQLFIVASNLNKNYTKRDCFVYMNCDEEVYWDANQLEAGVTFWTVCDKSKEILKEWLEWCLDERVNGYETSFSNKSEFPGFNGFCGKDQSILTNLAVRDGLNVDPNIVTYLECNADYWYERYFKGQVPMYRPIDEYLVEIKETTPYFNQTSTKHSLILTVHDKEWLIADVVRGIVDNTIGEYELIFVFDGCSDNSQEVAINAIGDGVDYKILTAPDVFETKANNIGIREASGEYVIIIQDDMVIDEYGWNRRLEKPFVKFDDVFAVTARTAHNYEFNYNSVHVNMEKDLDNCWCDIVRSCDEADSSNIPRNVFAVRGTVNRGPLMINLNDLKELNYFDEEFSPQDMDDHDLMFRMRKKLGKVCGCYWIGMRSDSEWGGTRVSGQPAPWLFKSQHKNSKIFYKRNKDFLEKYRIVQNRKIN